MDLARAASVAGALASGCATAAPTRVTGSAAATVAASARSSRRDSAATGRAYHARGVRAGAFTDLRHAAMCLH